MESVEKDCSVLGSLFQTIINDLRNSSPVWEDFTYKATKLHQCLKTTLVAISSFLEAFQKVADMATNSRGATKEMGSALTRLCMRHRSIETCLKALTNSVLDSVVAPLQEHLEDWKKSVAQLDKDHAKEYKKARQEIKKAASDTMRLQKKVNKGKNEMQRKLESSMKEVNDKYLLLEETEKNSIRTALIEERGRFCIFISCIKPFVDHEVHLLTEVTHLQEIMYSLCLQASDPHNLPPSSEQVISDLKGIDLTSLSLQSKQHPSPPSSPSSLGSRKSSVCSMASINSCSSTSSKSHSPGHTLQKHNTVQDSVARQNSTDTQEDSSSTPGSPPADLDATLTPSAFSTPSLPFAACPASRLERSRPHTISAGSEKAAFARLALTPELFEPLPEKAETGEESWGQDGGKGRSQSMSGGGHYARPGATTAAAAAITKMQPILPPHCPKPKVKAVAPPVLPPEMQPAYANTMELHQMAMEKREREQQQSIQGSNNDGTAPPPQQNPPQHDSQELAEAIRALEQSTAALHSTYDTDGHSSAQGSSGYTTMDSTPSSSDDVIPPGAGGSFVRRGSMNASRPLPPVRRTASISCSAGRSSRSSQQQGESFYAELQTVQQGILDRRQSQHHQQQQQQPPAVYSKPGQLQRQNSVDSPYQHEVTSPSPDRSSSSGGGGGGSGHYAVPVLPSAGSGPLLQTLNAQFAALTLQYQDPQALQRAAATYVGHSLDVDPGASGRMPPPGQQGQYHPAPYHPAAPSSRPSDASDPPPPPPPPDEDFPLPPTEQELAEMETVYARPPPVTPKPKMTGNLMMELKKRMSTDEYSNV